MRRVITVLIFDIEAFFVSVIHMTKPPTIDRKTLKTPDAFVQKGTQVLGNLSKSKIGIIPILVLGLVLSLGFYLFDEWEEGREQKAWSQYYLATKADVKEKWDKLKEVPTTWPKSRAAMLASVELGDHFFDEAKTELTKDKTKMESGAQSAVEWYGKALDYSKLLPIEKQLLLINRGNAFELQGKWNESIADYEKAYGLTGQGKGLALLGVGRSWEGQGDKEKALEAYEKLFTEFTSSEVGKVAKNHWRKIKSPLLQAGTVK